MGCKDFSGCNAFDYCDNFGNRHCIKTDNTARNHLRNRFKKLISEMIPEATAFRGNFEQLARALDNAGLQDEKGESINFDNASCIPEASRENLKITAHRTKRGNILRKDIDRVIDLGTLTVTSDKDKLFSGIFEIIYAIRCNLVHGALEPNENNHTVVKYAYLILLDLMKF